MRAEPNLRLLPDEHVAVAEVVGESLRCILALRLQPWWQEFPFVDSKSLRGCYLEDQCQPPQAWSHIL